MGSLNSLGVVITDDGLSASLTPIGGIVSAPATSSVSGTGTLTAQASTVDGSGTVGASVTGTGTLVTDACVIAGIGEVWTGTLTSNTVKNISGTPLANEVGMTVYVLNGITCGLITTFNNETTNGSAVTVVRDTNITASTTYRVVYKMSDGAIGIEELTAT